MERQMNRKTTKRKEIIERDRKTKWQKRLIINSQKERETERQRDRNKQRLLFKLLLLYFHLSQVRTLTIRHSCVFLSLCLSIFLSFCLFVFLFFCLSVFFSFCFWHSVFGIVVWVKFTKYETNLQLKSH